MYTQLVNDLMEYMELSGKTQRQVSKETDLSTSVISQFLKGNYGGNNEEVAKILMQYLELAKMRRFSIGHVKFCKELRNTQTVLFACQYAHSRNDIALVCGDAGAGKTTALEYYKNNNVGVVFVTANSCTASATAILSLICTQIGKTFTARKDVLMANLVEHFKDTNKLIIIDEADHLTLSALQAIRNLNDEAKVGIILSGNNKIYSQMVIGSKCSELQQLKTRIIVRRKVINEFTLEEFRKLFPGIDEECLKFLIKLAHSESLRTAIKILEIACDSEDHLNIKALQRVKAELTEGLY